jgi:hypothetical protein
MTVMNCSGYYVGNASEIACFGPHCLPIDDFHVKPRFWQAITMLIADQATFFDRNRTEQANACSPFLFLVRRSCSTGSQPKGPPTLYCMLTPLTQTKRLTSWQHKWHWVWVLSSTLFVDVSALGVGPTSASNGRMQFHDERSSVLRP